MFHLVYVSSAVIRFQESELTDLLHVARENNKLHRVTGMLLYIDGNFIQALEGEKADVKAIYAKIEQDQRHRGLVVLLEGELAQRNFPNWSMGFRNIGREEGKSRPGFSDFLDQKAHSAAPDSSALRLLEHFRTINT